MRGLAQFVLRHRKLILIGWLVLFLAGMASSSKATNRLTFDFSLPGQAGHEAHLKVQKIYGNGGENQPSLLVLSDDQPIPTAVADRTFAAVQANDPTARIVGHAQTNDAQFVRDGGRLQYALAFTRLPQGFSTPATDQLRTLLKQHAPAGVAADTTGLTELQSTSGGNNGPGVLLETLIGGVGALAVLAFVFASFLAFIPLVIAAVAILTTFLILLGITYIADVSFIVQFLVSLIGLGVAIDYSLLVVTRWREERARGKDPEEAMVTAIETAGHAVVFSGVTVAIGLAALIVLPVPFLRSIGYGGLLIPLVSTLVTLTLLPALLTWRYGGPIRRTRQFVGWITRRPHPVETRLFGVWADRPRIRNERDASRLWTRWGRMIVRRRWLAAGIATAILAVLMIPLLSISIGLAKSDSLAKSGPAYVALQKLEKSGMPTGALTPVEVLTTQASANDVASRLRQVPGIADAFAPTGEASQRAGTAVVIGVPQVETANATSIKPVKAVKKALDGTPGVIGITGVGPLQLDYLKAVYGNFALMLGLIVLVTYILLARAFRSLLLPLKAVVLNLASLAATFGAMVFFWQEGHGSEAVFNIAKTGAITFWLPIMVFAFLFGLSMDYEVFILSRMREEYDRSGNTDAAIVEGLGRTGRLVTSAALILFLAFLSLTSSPGTDIKLFATALGFGILLDATVVRALLVPALVSLFGSWNWYLPDWAAKVLRVQPSHAVPVPGPRHEVGKPAEEEGVRV
jgi:putative drug exporter of the RND superfamily